MELLLTQSLIAVAREGTIGKAAVRLRISQSALSRRLQQLEHELGASLLTPHGRGVVLTEAGRIAVAEGSALVERYDRMKAELRSSLSLDAGAVRIGGGATAVSYLLPNAMSRFRKAHPNVRFQLEEAGSREVEAAVLADRIELGIVTLPVVSRELDVRRLWVDRIVLVASKDHPLANHKRVAPGDLDGHTLIAFQGDTAIRTLIDEALRKAGAHVSVMMEVRSIAAMLRLVDSTSSLAFVSELSTDGRPIIDVRGLRVTRELGLVTQRGRALSPAGRAFADALVSGMRRASSSSDAG